MVLAQNGKVGEHGDMVLDWTLMIRADLLLGMDGSALQHIIWSCRIASLHLTSNLFCGALIFRNSVVRMVMPMPYCSFPAYHRPLFWQHLFTTSDNPMASMNGPTLFLDPRKVD